MGSPGVVEGKQTMKILLVAAFFAVALGAPSPRPLPMQTRQQTLLLTRGMDTTDGAATAATMVATTDPTDTMATMARGLLMPSPLPMPTLLLTRLLTPGMDTTAMATDPGDTTDPTDTATTTARGLLTPSRSPLPLLIPLPTLLPTPGTDTTDGADTVATTDPTDTTGTTARGLLMPSPRPRPPPTLLLIPPLTRGMDTTATVDGTDPTMAMDTTDTGHTDTATGDARTPATKLNIVLSLPTNTTEDQFLQNISLILFFKYFVLFNRVPGFIFQLKNNKVVKN